MLCVCGCVCVCVLGAVRIGEGGGALTSLFSRAGPGLPQGEVPRRQMVCAS